jgi:hypothetical protein
MRTLAPALIWLLFLLLAGPDFLLTHWEGALVVFSALAVVPLGLSLLGLPQSWPYALAAAGLAAGYVAYPAPTAAFFALPYLLLAAWLTVDAAAKLLIFKNFSWPEVLRVFALGYWTTGAGWAACFLAGIGPLGFDATITGLTAAHFHVAGFTLTAAVRCLFQENPSRANRLLGMAALLGMPLVAAGITASQLGHSPLLEQVSGGFFAAFAVGVAAQHVVLFFQKKHCPALSRWCWLLAAACLLAGAALASLYAMRFSLPLAWVNIPNMKVWHGTLNTLGFGWGTLLGWAFCRPVPKKPF